MYKYIMISDPNEKKTVIQEQDNVIKGSEDNLTIYPTSDTQRDDLTSLVTDSPPDQNADKNQ